MGRHFRAAQQGVTRRVVFGALAGMSGIGPLPAVGNPKEQMAQALQATVAAMTEIHGGEWSTHVDHESGFILVRLLSNPEPPE